MIRTVSDLLEAFLERERATLDKVKVPHAPTIGGMYEDLSRSALSQVIPSSAPLSVVSGFARGPSGSLSRELDCMLVVGDGDSIPRSEKVIYPLDQVLVVLQVKKNLYGTDVSKGVSNLKSVIDLKGVLPPGLRMSTVRRAFQMITHVPLPDDPEELPPELRAIYRWVLFEAAEPLRILLGYHGFKSENTLRRGVLDQIQKGMGQQGFGPLTLPQLITNRHAMVVKMNGLPWGSPMDDKGRLPLLASSGEQSTAYVLLQLIWSRLSSRGFVSGEVFGEDLEVETWSQFIKMKPVGEAGWTYHYGWVDVPDRIRESWDESTEEPWEPAFVSEEEFTLMNILCNSVDNSFDLNDIPAGFPSRSALEGHLQSLRGHGLVGKDAVREGVWTLLTEQASCVILPDGRFVVAENNSGRLLRWLNRYMLGSRGGGTVSTNASEASEHP